MNRSVGILRRLFLLIKDAWFLNEWAKTDRAIPIKRQIHKCPMIKPAASLKSALHKTIAKRIDTAILFRNA